MADLALAARLILAAVFVVAGVAKLVDRSRTRQAIGDFGVPRPLVSPVAAVLPIAELAVAGCLLVSPTATAGAVGAFVLLGLFMAATATILTRGRRPDCQCFGRVHSAPISWKTLVQNGVLAAMAAFVVSEGPGRSLSAWSSGISTVDWAILLVAIALVVAFVLEGSQLVDTWRQSRSPRDRTEVGPPGLPDER